MRKGAWINRPVSIKQKPATNKYDVLIAKIEALETMYVDSPIPSNSFAGGKQRQEILDEIKSLTKDILYIGRK